MRVLSGRPIVHEAKKIIQFFTKEMGVKKIRFPEHCGIGIKPVSKEGTPVGYNEPFNMPLIMIAIR